MTTQPGNTVFLQNHVPDWVAGELMSDTAASYSSQDPGPAPAVRSFDEVRERFHAAVARSPPPVTTPDQLLDYQRRRGGARTPSPPRMSPLMRDERVPPLHLVRAACICCLLSVSHISCQLYIHVHCLVDSVFYHPVSLGLTSYEYMCVCSPLRRGLPCCITQDM